MSSSWKIGLFMLATLWMSLARAAIANDFLARPDVQSFIGEVVNAHGFDREYVEKLIAAAEPQPRIIELMTRPAEARPWFEYRPIFLTDERAELGVEFWRRNASTLERAREHYGVDPAIIVSIIGVETKYGRIMGTFRVLDALTTLAFDYSKRGAEFQRYLEQFLILTRQEELNPLSVRGSYAGAMGMGQFMPGSYLEYAVDFGGDGVRELWTDEADVIGSVANYLSRHGWARGEPIAARVREDVKTARRELSDAGLRPVYPLEQLREWGYVPSGEFDDTEQLATVIGLETPSGTEYWLGFQNFYAITRYNHSPLYAMAVYQLSREIESRYRGG